jgi:hypothetical protein
METDDVEIEISAASSKIEVGIEAQNYVLLLVLVFNLDLKHYAQVFLLKSHNIECIQQHASQAVNVANELLQRIHANKQLCSGQVRSNFIMRRAHPTGYSL